MAINNELSSTLELKNVKEARGHEEGSPSWTATVYVNGVRSFTAYDDSWGSGELVFTPFKESDKNIIDKLEKEASEVTYECQFDKGKIYNKHLSIIISELEIEYCKERDFKKQLKKISYVNDGDIYSIAARFKPTKENLEEVKKSSWFEDHFILFNELSFSDGFELYKKTIAPKQFKG